MKSFWYVILIAGSFVSPPLYAAPVTISEAYLKARDHDALLGAAKADNLVYKEEVGKARAGLRPSVRLNASRGRNGTQHGYMGLYEAPDFYNTVVYGVTLRQPLINLSNIAEYQQAKAVAAKSDAELRKEEADLIVRLAETYCNALYAEDNLTFSQAHIKASEEQLQQAKRRFEKGFGTITEINEAQADLDMALAEGLEIVNSVEFSRRELEHLIGTYPDELCKLAPEKLVLARPTPGRVESWIDRAHGESPRSSAAHLEMQIAKKEIEKQKASRYPTIDLVAGRSYSESENNYSIGSTYETYSISLQMSMPIYTGGYASASIRQAKAKWLKAGEQFFWQERSIESEVRKYYNTVISTIAQIQAYEQAVKSREIALDGTKKGFGAGLRSNVDVLDALQNLLAARRNLAKSRYQYILARLSLKQTAGALSPADIEEINGWFATAKTAK
ncbi:TolC family outer membrane protein [Chlorobium phaeobacteroides]|jgi:protease secretion system outer membrane protein|uniref:Type I secretion outer membrane protein, TolC family n=1 Tax=Chlorobium phaeobacteroides (strain DSM 266 / SMG 266 / 2430) TaxID=290317 RepID=A1BH86_CHLPD|nr:TolC family outer membrane protein [Chlorobium phaeobacteroides]ABL65763.1 type I secretion outer membrane protein, TolC family [Chlorobium phaeobacteroides DSM 266]MBV5326106.1 TolC family outer membrane protein [Chlorobium sp.]